MKTSYQKGFSLMAIIMAIAAFFGGAHVMTDIQATSTPVASAETSSSQSASTQTYTSAQYGFSFQYPTDWSVCSNQNPDVEYVRVSDDCNASQNNQADYFMVRNIGDADLGKLQDGALKSDTGWNVFVRTAQMRAVYFQSKNINLVSVAMNAQDEGVLNQISGSFNATSASSNSTNPNMSGGLNISSETSVSSRADTTNPNMSGGLNVNASASISSIHINSMAPTSGPVGTRFTLNGNFNENGYGGPEYATDIVILDGATEEAYATFDIMPVNDTISFTIPATMCAHDMGGSGKPCDSPVSMKPGKYYLYYENTALKQMSNIIQFTITNN